MERKLEVVWPPSGFVVNPADDNADDQEGVQLEISLAGLNLEDARIELRALEGNIDHHEEAWISQGRAQLSLTVSEATSLVFVATRGELQVESEPLTLGFDPRLPACRIQYPRTGTVLKADDSVGGNAAAPNDGSGSTGNGQDRSFEEAFQSDVAVRCVGIGMGTPVHLQANGGYIGDAPLDPNQLAFFAGVELAEGINLLKATLDYERNDPPDAQKMPPESGSDPQSEADEPDPHPDKVEDHAVFSVETGACRLLLYPPHSTVFNADGEPPRGRFSRWNSTANRQPEAPMVGRIMVEHDCPGSIIELRLVEQVLVDPDDHPEPTDAEESPESGDSGFSGTENQEGPGGPQGSGGSDGSDGSTGSGAAGSGGSGSDGSQSDGSNSNGSGSNGSGSNGSQSDGSGSDGSSSDGSGSDGSSSDGSNSDGSGSNSSGSAGSGGSAGPDASDSEDPDSDDSQDSDAPGNSGGPQGSGGSDEAHGPGGPNASGNKRILVERVLTVLGTAVAEEEALSFDVELPEGEILIRAVAYGWSEARDPDDGSIVFSRPLAMEPPEPVLLGSSPKARYFVDSTQAQARITRPRHGAVLDSPSSSLDDSGLSHGILTTFEGHFENIEGGSRFELLISKEGGESWSESGWLEGSGHFSQELVLANGDYRVVAQAFRESGSRALSPPVHFTVAQVAGELHILSPENGSVLNLSDDASQRPGFQLGFSVAASGLVHASGRAGELSCGSFRAPFSLDGDGNASVLVDVEGLSCRGQELLCVAKLFHPRGTLDSKPLRLQVDTTPPALRLLHPKADAVLPEKEVSFEILSDCAGESQELRLFIDGVEESVQTIEDGAAIVGPVELSEGAHVARLELSDPSGNLSVLERNFAINQAPPVLTFLDPQQGGRVTYGPTQNQGNPELGFFRNIRIEVDGEPSGLGVELRVGQNPPLLAPAHPSEGRRIATFSQVALPEGDSLLKACASNLAGNVGCTEQWVRVVSQPPECVIEQPQDGQFFGIRNIDDGSDFPRLSPVVHTSAPDGVPVQLKLTNPSQIPTVLYSTSSQGVAEFEEFEFATEGKWSATAHCQLHPMPANSLPVDFTVDITPPKVDILAPANLSVFNLSSWDSSPEPGFQLELVLWSDEGQSGVLVDYEVVCGSESSSGSVENFDSDNSARVLVTVPDEASCQIRARARDGAGNESGWKVHHVLVDRIPPKVTIVSPQNNAVFGNLHDANPELPGFQLDTLTISMEGVRGNQPAQLTINGQQAQSPQVSPDFRQATWQQLNLDEGWNELKVEVFDGAGNSAVAIHQVRVVLSAPQLSIVSHVNGITLNRAADQDPLQPGMQQDIRLAGTGLVEGTSLRICLAAAEEQAGSQAAPWEIFCENGDPALAVKVLNDANLSLPRVSLPEGSIRFYAEAKDPLGNVGISPEVSLRVDTLPPVVSKLSIVQLINGVEVELDPRDGEAVFNLSHDSDPELSGFQTRLKAQLTGIEAGNPSDRWRRARFVSSNPNIGTLLGSTVIDSEGWASVDTTLLDGGHRIHVEVEDQAGNPNSRPEKPISGYEVATLNFGVDTKPPSLTLLSPTGGTFLVRREDGTSDDLDPALPGMQIDVELATTAEVGSEIQVFVDGMTAGSTILGDPEGRATLRITVPDGTRVLSATVESPSGNVGHAQPVTIVVDSVPPRLNLHRPLPNQVFREADGDDADPETPGFQVEVELSTADLEPGQTLYISSDEAGPLLSTTTPPSTESACPDDASRFCLKVTVNRGIQQLYARARDVSGNWGESAKVRIEVEMEGPSVWFGRPDSPIRFGQQHATDGTCYANIEAHTTAQSGQIELYSGQSLVSSAPVSEGKADLSLEIAGNQSVDLRLRVLDPQNGEGWSALRTALCDLSAPTLSFVSPKEGPDGEPVLYVPYGNPAQIPGAIADKLPSPELEADFTLNLIGAINGSLSLWSDRDGLLAQRSVQGNGQLLLANVVIPSPGAHVLTAIAENESGNQSSRTLNILSQVRAPGQVVLPDYATVLHSRRARVSLSFVAPDSGGDEGEPLVYQVRRSSSPIESEAAWLAAEVLEVEAEPLVPPGSVQTLVIDDLAFETLHFFAVRAEDSNGNLGPLSRNASLDLHLYRQELAAPPAATIVQPRQLVADLDGDGFDDLLVSSPVADGGEGAVYIYYGQNGNLSAPVVLKGSRSPSGSHLSARFGSSLAVGDVNGDGVLDLLVGAEYEAASAANPSNKEGAVHIFLGSLNGRLSESSLAESRIYGPPNPTSLAGIGPQLSVVEDLDGDGIDDVVIGANFENGRKGRVYIVSGRGSWPAELHTSTHDANQQNLQLLDALAALHTDWPLDFNLNNGPSFGNRLVSLGDLDGDGFGDFAISASGGSFPDVNAHRRVYVVSGKLARGMLAAEQISALIPAPLPRSQFGLALAAGDWNGDGVPDLAVAEAAGVRLYSGADVAPHLPQSPVSAPEVHNISQFTTLNLPGEGAVPVVVSNLGDLSGDGIDDVGASQVGPIGAINEVLLWKGRNSGSWGEADIRVLGEGKPNFGVRISAGRLTGSEHPDLVILDLDSNTTVLSGP